MCVRKHTSLSRGVSNFISNFKFQTKLPIDLRLFLMEALKIICEKHLLGPVLGINKIFLKPSYTIGFGSNPSLNGVIQHCDVHPFGLLSFRKWGKEAVARL